jgi:hypothetical protein
MPLVTGLRNQEVIVREANEMKQSSSPILLLELGMMRGESDLDGWTEIRPAVEFVWQAALLIPSS